MHFCVSLYDGLKVTKVIKVSKEDEKEMIIIEHMKKILTVNVSWT